jgi:predicted DNA-binding WGR domain protein
MIDILHSVALKSIDPKQNRYRAYYAQVVGIPGGYVAFGHWGRIGNALQERRLCAEPSTYEAAKSAYREIVNAKRNEGYELDGDDVPATVQRYADGDYRRVEDVQAYCIEHDAELLGEVGAEQLQAIRDDREQKRLEEGRKIVALLCDESTVLDATPKHLSVVEKQGAKVAADGIDVATARLIAQEIGGSFKASGVLVNGRFHIYEFDASPRTAEEALEYARPHVVTMEKATCESTHGDLIAAVRAIIHGRSTEALRIITADGRSSVIKTVDILAHADAISSELSSV